MRYFSYVVARDYGFAPNPFLGICTLATCKPDIRKAAGVGDWIFGTGSAKWKLTGHLVFAMNVTEKDSHHSHEDGSVNLYNLERDTSVDFVLIASTFYYFGKNAWKIPGRLTRHVVKSGRGHRCPEPKYAETLLGALSEFGEPGYYGDPIQFESFQRYNGRS
jgi:hypothetical protein